MSKVFEGHDTSDVDSLSVLEYCGLSNTVCKENDTAHHHFTMSRSPYLYPYDHYDDDDDDYHYSCCC